MIPETTTVLFIGGVGRSGSTLLDRMLGQLPEFCSVGETVHLWSRLIDDDLCGCGASLRDCSFWREVSRHAFGGWDAVDLKAMLALQNAVDRNRFIPLMLAPTLAPRHRRDLGLYTAYLSRLYEAIRVVSGAHVVVDSAKHASYAFLLRRVPGIDLRLVHLVRDSRGVAYSWMKRVKKSHQPGVGEMAQLHPARSSLRWVAYNLLFDLLKTLNVPSLFLTYEALIERPQAELRRVLELLGEPSDADALSFVGSHHVELGATHTASGNPMRFDQGRVVLRADDEWRRRLSPRNRWLVNSLTWPAMVRYGYFGPKRRA
ncbi:MAG: sulfotransferase [Actinomycetota bacterium]|nr:sulfotransferase [Actinomycetota bacterium]